MAAPSKSPRSTFKDLNSAAPAASQKSQRAENVEKGKRVKHNKLTPEMLIDTLTDW